MSAGRVLVPLAQGFEEIEAITIIDVLRRADLEVVTAALDKKQVRGSHDIVVHADTVLEDVDASGFDAIILPGGLPGSEHLRECGKLQEALRAAADRGAVTGAICAAPWALEPSGVTEGKRATSHPAFADKMVGVDYVEDAVAIDGNVFTSRGVGAALEFSLELVARLVNREKADALAAAMVVD